MRSSPVSNNVLLRVFLAACLLLSSSCHSRVVIGRSAAMESKPPVKKAEPAKAEEKKPAAQAAKPEETPAKPAEKPKGMGSLPGKKEKAAENPAGKPAENPAEKQVAAAQSAPRPQSSPKEEKPKSPGGPYRLDLSFGGFGLGVGLFDTPVAVGVDDQENIYVVDQGNYRVQKFDRFGIFQFAWGRQGMGDGEFTEQSVPPHGLVLRMTGDFEFNRPTGMLLDKDEVRNLIRVHVVDTLNNRIERFLLTQNPAERFPDTGADNVFIMLAKTGNVPDTGPNSLQEKFANESRQVILSPIYLTDTSGKANALLLAPFIWGGLGYTQGLMNQPTYIAKDPDSNILYVSDTENGRVQGFNLNPTVVSSDATFYREWGNDINLPYGAGRLKEPTAIAFDNMAFGGFLVLDRLQGGGYNIQRFDREGNYVGVFNSSGDKEGQYRQPVCIAINTFDNTVFVTDRGRKKVMVYNNKGEFMYEFGDELEDPRGITVLRNNYVYVTDAAKNMVFRYVPK